MRRGYVVLDTDIASLHFKNQLPPSLADRLRDADLCLTFVALGELTKWAKFRNWGSRTHAAFAEWLGDLPVLPYDEEVATMWGGLQADGMRRGRARPVNDSWVAACCLVGRLPLATRNMKDFVDFAAHDGLTLVTGQVAELN